MPAKKLFKDTRALRHLMDLLAVEGLSGQEGRVAAAVRAKLLDAGCRASWIRFDRANQKMPGAYEVGNCIVKIPGTIKTPRRLFMGHLDTVPLCRGARPVRKGSRIVSQSKTALGGDNRTAVACLVNMVETVLKQKLPHPPLTILFTIAEEVGLYGSRFVDLADLGQPAMGFNIDSGNPRVMIVGAVGADRWEVEVHGRSSHAGVHPEDGVSATLIASHAIVDVASHGFFGKIVKGQRRGTSNVGVMHGGEATNQVTDFVRVRGESRSHDRRFLQTITANYRRAFERAAKRVKNRQGRTGSVAFRATREYDAFRMGERAPPVVLAVNRAKTMGLRPELRIADGGLDANHLNARGIPTVTLGAGQHKAHTVDEYVDIAEYLRGCRLAVLLATES